VVRLGTGSTRAGKAYRKHNFDLIELTREASFGPHSDAKLRELVERIGWRNVDAE